MAFACEMGAGMWWGMWLPAALLAALIIGGGVVARTLWSRGHNDGGDTSAMSLLERRFASGEIDHEEFTARRDQLLTGEG